MLFAPIGVFDAPIGVFDTPKRVFDVPIGVFDAPIRDFDAPIRVFDSSIGVFDSPIGVFDSPKGIFDTPIGVFDTPIGVFDAPIGVNTIIKKNAITSLLVMASVSLVRKCQPVYLIKSLHWKISLLITQVVLLDLVETAIVAVLEETVCEG
jgi:hypothetical protein